MTVQTYLDRNSILHKLDERVKLLWTFSFIIGLFLTSNLVVLAFLSLFMIIFSISCVGFKPSYKTFSNINFMIFILILCSFLTRREEPWLINNVLSVSSFKYTLLLILRFISISYASVLLFQTSRIERIIRALTYFKLPKNFALTITLSFRFIPFVFETMDLVEQSHRLRTNGSKFTFKEKISLLNHKLISAIIVSLKSATNLAMHLSHRGFNSYKTTTSFTTFKKRWYNFILVILALLTPYLIYLTKYLLIYLPSFLR